MSTLFRNSRPVIFSKLTLILALSVGLVAILVLRPYLFEKKRPARIEDRLPDADFLGRAYILDIVEESSSLMFYNKLPFRDLITQEFILSQAKLYGLDLQKRTYFFANEDGEWGTIVQVNDSSKIMDGINRLKKFIELSDTTDLEQHVYTYKKEKLYLTYSNSYVFLYKGNRFHERHKRILFAQYGNQSSSWKKFLRHRQFKDERLVIYANWKKLTNQGVKTAMFAHDVDSVSLRLKAYIEAKEPLRIKKKKSGLSIRPKVPAEKLLNMHLDISDLRSVQKDPLLDLLNNFNRRIRFPITDFLKAWEGDLAFYQGGFYPSTESYIESIMDDNFNVTEVRKSKVVMVPGYTLALSVNKHFQELLQKLFGKGLLWQDGDGVRFLFSPKLKMTKQKDYVIFHSGSVLPKLADDSQNLCVWNSSGTTYHFRLDSMSRSELFGSIHFPVKKLISRNRFF